jgi:hypothetical protein
MVAAHRHDAVAIRGCSRSIAPAVRNLRTTARLDLIFDDDRAI